MTHPRRMPGSVRKSPGKRAPRTMPPLVRRVSPLRRLTAAWRRAGETIAFVPTMGALHEGHRRLIERATAPGRRVVVSIFVNPLQFGPREDFGAYPRTLAMDRRLCAEAGADLVFVPDASVLYPTGFATRVQVTGLDRHLCGPFRPGHFEGVTTVVLKLLMLVGPDVLFLGQKDAQQAAIVGRMIRDLDLPVRLRVVPTVRERDGLALSSRNRYLTPEERAVAPVLYRALRAVRDAVRAGGGSPDAALAAGRRLLAETPALSLEYLELVDAATLAPVSRLEGDLIIAVAARLGRARLIDNIPVRAPRRRTVSRGVRT